MIRRKDERPVNVFENRYGGAGAVKGRLFSQITLAPGCGIGVHTHENEWEAFYILSGQAELTDNGEVHTLSPGDMHLCHAGHSHGVHNAGTEDVEMVALILYA